MKIVFQVLPPEEPDEDSIAAFEHVENNVPEELLIHITASMTTNHRTQLLTGGAIDYREVIEKDALEALGVLCRAHGVELHVLLDPKIPSRHYTLSIDFDGTLTTEPTFPEIGQLDMEMVEAAKACKEAGHTLLLWTCREGQYLADAVGALKQSGLEFDAINTCIDPIPELPFTRKPYADFIYDDKNYNWNRGEALAHLRSLAKREQ